jgi:hypothetical protein
MLGKKTPLRSVPFFWTVFFFFLVSGHSPVMTPQVQYGKSLRYCGHLPTYDDVIVHGDLENFKFIAFYLKVDFIFFSD